MSDRISTSLPPHLLGRHVRHSPLDGARVRERCTGFGVDAARFSQSLGQTEVEHLRVPAGRQHDVRWLQIAMNDLSGMRRFQGLRHLHGDAKDILHRQRCRIEPAPQRVAAHVLHGDERTPVFLARLIDLADVGMVERCRSLRFAQETTPRCFLPLQRGGKEFQRDRPIEHSILRQEHQTHAASAEQRLDLIGAEHGARTRFGLGVVRNSGELEEGIVSVVGQEIRDLAPEIGIAHPNRRHMGGPLARRARQRLCDRLLHLYPSFRRHR